MSQVEMRPTPTPVPESTPTVPLFPRTLSFLDTTTRAIFALLGISLPAEERQHYATSRFWLISGITIVFVFLSVWAVVWMMANLG